MAGLDERAENYRSASGPRAGWFSRHFPSLSFYSRMVGVVFRASRACKRGAYDDAEWIGSSREILDILESVGGTIEVSGMEHVRATPGPVLFLGNHMSTLETFILPWILRSKLPLTFVVKEGLLRYPVFKEVMANRDPVVVTRTNAKEDLVTVLREGVARMEKGRSMIIFPQTTRTLYFDPQSFNTIGVKLARRAGVPVIPLAVKTDAWRTDGWPVKEFGRIEPEKPVRLAFGAPLTIGGNGKAENEAAAGFIAEHLGSWGIPVKGPNPS